MLAYTTSGKQTQDDSGQFTTRIRASITTTAASLANNSIPASTDHTRL